MPEILDLNLDCNFGGVSVGDQTCSVGVKLAREKVGLAQASETFCGRRLGIIMKRGPAGGEDPRQNRIPGTEDAFDEIAASADVKRLSLDPKDYSFRLTLSIGEVDPGTLAHFAKRSGKLEIKSAELLPETDDEDDGIDDHDDVGPRPKNGRKRKTSPLPLGNDQGSGMALSALVDYGLTGNECETLAKAVGPTIKHLEEAMRKNEYWHRDIPGFGDKKIGKLQDAHLKFRQAYPPETNEDRERAQRAQDAYTAGCQAAVDDEPANNPFPEGSPERPAWQRGYDEANESPSDDPAGASARNRSKAAKGKTAFDVAEGANAEKPK